MRDVSAAPVPFGSRHPSPLGLQSRLWLGFGSAPSIRSFSLVFPFSALRLVVPAAHAGAHARTHARRCARTRAHAHAHQHARTHAHAHTARTRRVDLSALLCVQVASMYHAMKSLPLSTTMVWLDTDVVQ
eukprot:6208552-Pleurochrysis_carterae.AAC.1